MNIRWPFVTRRKYDCDLQVLVDTAEELVRAEYSRRNRACAANVHAWAVEATSNLLQEGNPVILRAKTLAAFQQADQLFRPDPLTPNELLNRRNLHRTVSDYLYK